MNDAEKAKARSVLQGIPTEELPWVIGRFCGPGNELICEKKFGCIIERDIVEEEMMHRLENLIDDTLTE